MGRHLRVEGDEKAWRAKLVEDYNIDDKHHKDAMMALIGDIREMAVVRNYYIDSETLLELYDKHMVYKEKNNEIV